MIKLLFILLCSITLPSYAQTAENPVSSSPASPADNSNQPTNVNNNNQPNPANNAQATTPTNTQPTPPSNTNNTAQPAAQNNTSYAVASQEVTAGLQAISRSDYKSAIRIFQAYLKTHPDDKTALIGLARAEILQENYAEGEKQLALYKAKFGEDEAYLTEKARDLALTNHPQEALVIVTPLLQKDPTNDTLLDIKQFAETHAATSGVAPTSTTPTSPASATPLIPVSPEISAAAQAANNKEYDKAIQIYQQELNKNPNDKVAFIGLIRVQSLKENYSETLRLLNKYKTTFGEDDQYLTEKARYLAFTDNSKQALAIIAPLLKKDPTNDTLLDIKKFALAHPSQPSSKASSEMANKLARMAIAERNNPILFFRAAHAYFDSGDSKRALQMINWAIQLDPNNNTYLFFRAKVANDLDDQNTLYCTYRQLYLQNPHSQEALFGLASAADRLDKYDEAAKLYALYMRKYPQDGRAWLRFAYVQDWMGNSRVAVLTLDNYYNCFGGSKEYWIERARILSEANRPSQALPLICSILPRVPNDYDINYANTTALFYNNQPIEMFQSLKKVIQLAPNENQTKGLIYYITTPYRSNISLDNYDSFDSDTVKIFKSTLGGQYFITPLTSILGNAYYERLSASVSSGLAPIEGGNALHITGFNLGMNHRFTPAIDLQGLIGTAHASDNENTVTYQGDAFFRIYDTSQIDFQVKRSFYDESARSVSRGVKQNLNRMVISWQPCLQCNISATAGYATFTDSNIMWSAELTPGFDIITSDRLNFNLGIDAQWYDFRKQLGNGYYDPSAYRFLSLVSDVYIKQTDNIGYEFTAGIGTQKDATFTAFQAANDYTARGYFGIYQDWYLIVTAAASTRGRSITDNPSQNYRVYSFDATITRRF